ncbi:DUF805 domain-containing protein [Hoeflea poritis]|uniref:DUF805 domain-containing protein n=1 Tax=Hoeflea poritis TaxID=2993659 RepID=A0ABT4VUE8_9HYPH|nr:DUF805 domain-containing protein [Hoeflea poritis]MDA4848342.1 DUF805 domain-containing protein [Hoeflea poritis]
MGFKEAVRTCLREKYAVFSGRACRSEFWYFMLFMYLVPIVLGILGLILIDIDRLTAEDMNSMISTIIIVYGAAGGLIVLATILPGISVAVRRFHDVNLSGWWILACIIGSAIPFVGIIGTLAPFVIGLIKGTDGDNKFGPDPLVQRHTADVFA